MKQAVNNKYKLQNREQMDVLETYLGDCSYMFSWCDRGYVKSDYLINEYSKPALKAELIEYPSDIAQVKLTLEIYSNNKLQCKFILGVVDINDPSGPKLFNLKIKAVILALTTSINQLIESWPLISSMEAHEEGEAERLCMQD